MLITKKQARLRGITESHICKFHLNNPDQQGIMEVCKRCKIIQDPCGCDEDSFCSDCDPYKEEKKYAVQAFISKLFSKEAIEAGAIAHALYHTPFGLTEGQKELMKRGELQKHVRIILKATIKAAKEE